MFLEELLLEIAYDLVAVLIPILVAMMIEFLRKQLGIGKVRKIQQVLETKETLALLAVRFVEQTYSDLHGQDKYNKAAIWLSARAQENGLTLSDSEIKGLIEAALRKLKDEFAEQWQSSPRI